MSLPPHLRSPKEHPLFLLSVTVSALLWILAAASVVGLAWGAAAGLALLAGHALHLAHVRGTGVRLSERQLPDLHARVRSASAVLGLPRTPEVYVVRGRGRLEAFAAGFLYRRFLVLPADLVDECQDPRQLDFVVAHELARHAAGHLAWRAFLAPSMLVPLLGPAYGRACELTCDRAGASVCGDTEQAIRGLMVLSAGGRIAQVADLDAFMAQADEAGAFWMAVRELGAYRPFACKRVAALKEYAAPGTTRVAPRSPLAYVLAPFLPFGALGGAGLAGAVAVLAALALAAALAAPAVIAWRERPRTSPAAAQEQPAAAPEPPPAAAAPQEEPAAADGGGQ